MSCISRSISLMASLHSRSRAASESEKLPVGFIPQLMLQTGPHIHGNGTQLDLHRQMQRPLGDDDGYVDDQVQTAIAGFLGLLDVVHLPQHLEGFGSGQQAAEIVDVIQIVADDPDTGYVLYVGIDIVDGDVVAPAAQLIR